MSTAQNLKHLSEMPQLEGNTDGTVDANVPNKENRRNTRKSYPKESRHWCIGVRRKVAKVSYVPGESNLCGTEVSQLWILL